MRAALLLAILLAGCVNGAAPEPDAPRDDTQTDDASLRPIEQTFEGSATGTPAAPFVEEFPFEVPRGAVGVNGTLLWERPPVDAPLGLSDMLELALLDPSGEVVSEGRRDEASGGLVVVTVEPPKPGTWTFRVSSSAAANTPFTLTAVAQLLVPEHNLLTKSLSLGGRGFYEINMILEENASFVFSYNASAPVKWDVHSHPSGEVKYWEEGSGTSGGTTFTAPSRDVFSILWENEGPLAADLSYEVDGRFRIHSHSG